MRVAYTCGLLLNALSVAVLSAPDALLDLAATVEGASPAIGQRLFAVAWSWTRARSVGSSMKVFSIAAYTCAPHIAATLALVWARTERPGWSIARRVLIPVLVAATVAWGSLRLPVAAFGVDL